MVSKLRRIATTTLGVLVAGVMSLPINSASACLSGEDPVIAEKSKKSVDYYMLAPERDDGDAMFIYLSRDDLMHVTVGFKTKSPHIGAGYKRNTLAITAREPDCNERCFPNGLWYNIKDCDYTGFSVELGYDLTPGHGKDFSHVNPVAMDFPGSCGEQIACEVIQEHYAERFPNYQFFPLGNEAGIFIHPDYIDCDKGLQDCWDSGKAREFKKIWKRDKYDPCNTCD